MESPKTSLSEGECLQGCQSTQHGRALTSVLSMRGISDAATISYLRWLCCNCGQVVDSLGRSALHVAASCGGGEAARWLVRHCGANANLRDVESGYTPLHRSIFYGQIHVATSLIRLGASISALDFDDLTPLDHAMKDRMPYVEYTLGNPCEVYSWGNNNNYTLGVGNQRAVPELLDYFRKQNISVRQVAMNKFHSVFVSHDGRAFSCGHGLGGRLGLGGEQAALQPAPVRLPEETRVAAAALGRDHSVLLADGGVVLTCGLNTHRQLGHSPAPSQLSTPRALAQRLLRPVGAVQGVCAGRFHTVVWSPKGLMTFGLHAGQLGHPKGPELLQTVPRFVSAFSHKEAIITLVAASDGATVVVTSKGDVYALHDYQCHKITSRLLDIVKVEVIGGHLDSRVDTNTLVDRGGDHLKIAVLTSTGKLLLWQESSQQLLRCIFSINRPLVVTDVALSRSSTLLLVTRDGEAFEGEIRARKPKKASIAPPGQGGSAPAFHEFLEKSECEQVKVKRLLHIHRAVSASCDPKGRNFAVVQTHPQAALLSIPAVETSEANEQMKTLLMDACTQDLIHDVVFVVGAREFPAHRFIVASQSEPLAKMMENKIAVSEQTPRVKVNNVKPDVFEQILQFIYSGECDMLKSGACCFKGPVRECKENNEDMIDLNSVSAYEVYSEQVSSKKVKNKQMSKKQNQNSKKHQASKKQINDPVKVLQDTARKFGLVFFSKLLNDVKYENDVIKVERNIQPVDVKFDRKNYQDLYDVSVKSEEGKEIRAHKCMLTAKLEYFNSMLNHGWLESFQTSKLQLPVPHKVLEILIDFLYQNDSPLVRQSDDLDFVLNILVVADQFFVTRLKEICEVTLAGLITLRNVAKILQIADTYNANQLKQCCMQYICLNLSAILEMRGLEYVSDSVLQGLSKYYQDFNPHLSKRVITPYADAPSQSFVESVAEAHPVKFGDNEDECDINESSLKKNVKGTKKKARIRKTGVNNTNEVNERVRNESLSSNQSNISDDEKHSLNFTDLIERPNSNDVTLELSKLDVNKSSPAGDSKWIKVEDNKKLYKKSLRARLKVIQDVMEDSSILLIEDNFTTLTKLSDKVSLIQNQSNSSVSSPQPIPNATPQATVSVIPQSPPPNLISDFPELCPSSLSLHDSHNKLHHKNPEIKNPIKVSQKQRKKMAAELADQTEKGNREPPRLPWGLSSTPTSSSFLEIMHEETSLSKQLTGATTSFDTDSGPSAESSPCSNPWSKMQVSPIGSPANTIQFCNIVADEKKQRTNWTKMLAKPLELTQLEDRAIEDLLLFYNASGASDERITVRRVITDNVAVPTWITSHH